MHVCKKPTNLMKLFLNFYFKSIFCVYIYNLPLYQAYNLIVVNVLLYIRVCLNQYFNYLH